MRCDISANNRRVVPRIVSAAYLDELTRISEIAGSFLVLVAH